MDSSRPRTGGRSTSIATACRGAALGGWRRDGRWATPRRRAGKGRRGAAGGRGGGGGRRGEGEKGPQGEPGRGDGEGAGWVGRRGPRQKTASPRRASHSIARR